MLERAPGLSDQAARNYLGGFGYGGELRSNDATRGGVVCIDQARVIKIIGNNNKARGAEPYSFRVSIFRLCLPVTE